MLILERPWTRQPQTVVGIDPKHPLARQDWRLVSVGSQKPWGSANPEVTLPTAGAVVGVGAKGTWRGINRAASADYVSYGANTQLQLNSSCGVCLFYQGGTKQTAIFVTRISVPATQGGFSVVVQVGAAPFMAKNDMVAMGIMTGVTMSVGIHCLAWSHNNSTGAWILALDGLAQSGTVSTQTFTHGTVGAAGYYSDVQPTAPDIQYQFMLAVAANPTTNIGALRELSVNPWSLFQSRRIYIPTAAAAATAPNITALSARLITATSAQPRISYS